MSKQGHYLRHPWTHRSHFQKSKEFGRIDLEECTVDDVEILCPGSDDELSDSGRAVKRRRIERLAEGFIRGETLKIPSVRPCPQALKRTITWHKKSSDEPGFKLQDVNVSPDASHLWRDVEDDDEILQRLLRKPKAHKAGGNSRAATSDPVASDSVEHVTAQASCKPVSRLRTATISVGPSEEALQKAAALRNRRGRVAVAEISTVAEKPASLATPVSDPAECITVTQSERILRSRGDKSEWLSRRKSRFSFGNMDAPATPDAASTPCVGVTPRSAKHVATSSPAQRTAPDELAIEADRSEQQNDFPQPVSPAGVVPQEPIEVSRSSVTAAKRHEPQSLSGNELHVDVQTDEGRAELTAKPGVAGAHASCNVPASRGRSNLAPASGGTEVAVRQRHTYLQAPATQNNTTPLMYRKRTTRSTVAAQAHGAVSAPTTGQGRAPSTGNEVSSAPTRRSTRRRMVFPSSEDVQPAVSPRKIKQQQHVASHPPVLDMSLNTDYSFAPKLNMALVEEHTNHFLPVEPQSEGRTSSVKKALRREMQDGGAELSRCDSEPPPTSQIEAPSLPAPHASEVASVPMRIQDKRESTRTSSHSERRQTWLGTQEMVARAERDLFTSPKKPGGSVFTPINERSTTSYTPASQEREPLKQLSKEPALPSTQAMLEGFNGFSTVKKPRGPAVLKGVDEGTPVVVGKGKKVDARVDGGKGRSSSGSAMAAPGQAKEKRGSSLRFSISSLESPMADVDDVNDTHRTALAGAVTVDDLTTTSIATPTSSSSRRTSTRRSALKTGHQPPATASPPISPRRATDDPQATSLSEDFPTSRFFHLHRQPLAERDAPGSELLSETSNLSQTIDDLARDVLGSARDVEGVMSQ